MIFCDQSYIIHQQGIVGGYAVYLSMVSIEGSEWRWLEISVMYLLRRTWYHLHVLTFMLEERISHVGITNSYLGLTESYSDISRWPQTIWYGHWLDSIPVQVVIIAKGGKRSSSCVSRAISIVSTQLTLGMLQLIQVSEVINLSGWLYSSDNLRDRPSTKTLLILINSPFLRRAVLIAGNVCVEKALIRGLFFNDWIGHDRV